MGKENSGTSSSVSGLGNGQGAPNDESPSGRWYSGLLAHLILLLISGLSLVGVTIFVAFTGFDSLGGQLKNFSRQTILAHDAAYEIEIKLLGGELTGNMYLVRADPQLLKLMEENGREFRQYLEQFSALAKDPDSAAAVEKISRLSDELRAVAQKLMARREMERKTLERLVHVARMLETRIDARHVDYPDIGARQLKLYSRMNELALQMSGYLMLNQSESRRTAMEELAKIREGGGVQAIRGGNTSSPEFPEAELVEAVIADVSGLLDAHGEKEANLKRFYELRLQIYDVIHNRIQIFASRELQTANQFAASQIDKNLFRMMILSVLSLVIFGIAVWVVMTRVVRPIGYMLKATDAFAKGDLSHRIPSGAIGELAALSTGMNRMAGELDAARAQMAEMNAGLGNLVAKRTQELAVANHDLLIALDKANEGSRAKSVFLANMSHELRTPLNAIIGFAQIMNEEMFGPLGSAKYKVYTEDIAVSGAHLLRMISNILDLSQMETGDFIQHCENVDLSMLIKECLEEFEAKAGRSDLRLQMNLEEALPEIRADSLRLKQVIRNLIDNAINFNKSGGWVNIEAGRSKGNGVTITVSDNGSGMADVESLLEISILNRSDALIAHGEQGPGLGLPMSKILLERMGAQLHIDSTLNVGTRVSILFPGESVTAAA